MIEYKVRTETGLSREIASLFRLRRFGIKLGLDTIREAAARLGNPERQFRSIHIAGTNGKGSTAAYCASALRTSGAKVGLYTSPHLVRFNERIRIDGRSISDQRLAALIPRVRATSSKLTFFEFATLLAFLHFAESGLDWAIVEVGMGGRLDATNILTPEITVLTSVSIDHAEYLGATLSRIAGEKLGIVKPAVPVVCGWRAPALVRLAERKCEAAGSPFLRIGRDFSAISVVGTGRRKGEQFRFKDGNHARLFRTSLGGAHQIENAALAVAAMTRLGVPHRTIRAGLVRTRWAGRFQQVGRFILDGAHNADGIRALVSTLRDRFALQRFTVILGAMRDKSIDEMVAQLAAIASRWVLVRPGDPRGAPTSLLRTITKAYSHPTSSHRSLAAAIASTRGPTLITGSLHLVGSALAIVQKKRTARSAVPTGYPLRV